MLQVLGDDHICKMDVLCPSWGMLNKPQLSMTMSAEYRPKFEDFTGNGDVSILTEKFSSRTNKLTGI